MVPFVDLRVCIERPRSPPLALARALAIHAPLSRATIAHSDIYSARNALILVIRVILTYIRDIYEHNSRAELLLEAVSLHVGYAREILNLQV